MAALWDSVYEIYKPQLVDVKTKRKNNNINYNNYKYGYRKYKMRHTNYNTRYKITKSKSKLQYGIWKLHNESRSYNMGYKHYKMKFRLQNKIQKLKYDIWSTRISLLTTVFIHVECFHILKRQLSFFVIFNQFLVRSKWGGTWESNNNRNTPETIAPYTQYNLYATTPCKLTNNWSTQTNTIYPRCYPKLHQQLTCWQAQHIISGRSRVECRYLLQYVMSSMRRHSTIIFLNHKSHIEV